MKELSIFIDESGDFGEVKNRPAYSLDERRKLLYKMLYFYNKCEIYHDTVIVNRKEATDKIALSGRLSKEISKMILKHASYFRQYDKVIVYYDNGQTELSAILNAVLSILFDDVEFRRAEPQKYRLLQVADFVCSLELLKIKRAEKRLSKSEEKFFYKSQELKKTFLKNLDNKRLK